MSECAICLSTVALEDEAYVGGACLHRFCYSCISQWTKQQREHPIPADERGRGADPDYRCPLCKQPYSYILHDCVLDSFRVEYVDEAAKRRGAAAGLGRGIELSAAHRRRRSLYVKQRPAARDAAGGAEAEAATGGWLGGSGGVGSARTGEAAGSEGPGVPAPAQAAAALRHVVVRPTPKAAVRRPDDPEVHDFVKRELQAVLLCADIDLVSQHTLGVLRNMLGPGASGGGRPAKKPRVGPPDVPHEFVPRLARAMATFLDDRSTTFAEQVHLFLLSGLSVKAYDVRVFGAAATLTGADEGDGGKRQGAAEGRPSAGVDTSNIPLGYSVGDSDDFDDYDGE